MNILCYDTETTGLPLWHTPSDDPNQPHIVQLAAVLFDEDSGEELDHFAHLIRPEGWEWDETNEAFQTHGITAEKCLAEGIAETEAVARLLEMVPKAGMRMGHNESFDRRMVRIVLKRSGLLDYADGPWKVMDSFCTCNQSKWLCDLPPTEAMLRANRKGPKAPKLEEAYRHFFGEELEGGHDALVDVRASIRIFGAIKKAKAAAKA